MAVNIQDLLKQFQEKEEAVRTANIKRQARIETLLDDIIARFGAGGTYGQAALMQLERAKVRDVGAAAQRDIGRGLYGIRPYEQEWEETAGAAGRATLEDIRMERLTEAQQAKAGFLERIEEPYPEYGMLMQAAIAEASKPKVRSFRVAPQLHSTKLSTGPSQPITKWKQKSQIQVPYKTGISAYGTVGGRAKKTTKAASLPYRPGRYALPYAKSSGRYALPYAKSYGTSGAW